jgi:hypothetical protein
MSLDNVSRDDWIVGGLALLLAIDVLFLPWFSISVGVGAFSASFSSTATGAPDGWLGILALIAVIALLADLGIERLSPQTTLPMLGGSRTMTRFILAGAGGAFLLLKFIFHINHFSDLGFGFWAAVVLTGGLVFSTMRASQGQAIAPPSAPSAPPPPPPAPPAS